MEYRFKLGQAVLEIVSYYIAHSENRSALRGANYLSRFGYTDFTLLNDRLVSLQLLCVFVVEELLGQPLLQRSHVHVKCKPGSLRVTLKYDQGHL